MARKGARQTERTEWQEAKHGEDRDGQNEDEGELHPVVPLGCSQ